MKFSLTIKFHRNIFLRATEISSQYINMHFNTKSVVSPHVVAVLPKCTVIDIEYI